MIYILIGCFAYLVFLNYKLYKVSKRIKKHLDKLYKQSIL